MSSLATDPQALQVDKTQVSVKATVWIPVALSFIWATSVLCLPPDASRGPLLIPHAGVSLGAQSAHSVESSKLKP